MGYFKVIVIILVGLLTSCKNTDSSPTNSAFKKSNSPNIIYILADDLGYGDLSYYGQQKFATPNIALLVAELKKQGDPRIFGQGEIFDNYQYAHPSSENFYERFTNGKEMKAGWVNPSDF